MPVQVDPPSHPRFQEMHPTFAAADIERMRPPRRAAKVRRRRETSGGRQGRARRLCRSCGPCRRLRARRVRPASQLPITVPASSSARWSSFPAARLWWTRSPRARSRRLLSAAERAAVAAGRRRRARRADHARADPAAGGAHPGRRGRRNRGAAGSADVVRLQNFLARNGYPNHVLDPATDPAGKDAHRQLRRSGRAGAARGLPGRPGARQSDRGGAGAADRHGRPPAAGLRLRRGGGRGRPGRALDRRLRRSEGLSVAVLDARAFGGQAGASARIENYLGFPTGITGQALQRGRSSGPNSAPTSLIPAAAKTLDCAAREGALAIEWTRRAVRARRSSSPAGRATAARRFRDRALRGRGVWYWASLIEARPVRRRGGHRWSAAATRPGRARCSCPPTPRKCG